MQITTEHRVSCAAPYVLISYLSYTRCREYICISPNLPIHPTPCPQACCVFNLLSALNFSNKVGIFWEHILFQPLNPLFLCPFSTKHDVSESYKMSSLFCLGCGGQRRVVLVPLGASLLGNEGKKERWWVICCLPNTSIFSLPFPDLFLQTYIHWLKCLYSRMLGIENISLKHIIFFSLLPT